MIYKMWEHENWGNAINWIDFDERKIVGWLSKKPEVGDLIRSKMQSGKVAEFKVISVDYKMDPPDMFFATLEDVRYVPEEEL